jgi:hypothetical protein
MYHDADCSMYWDISRDVSMSDGYNAGCSLCEAVSRDMSVRYLRCM